MAFRQRRLEVAHAREQNEAASYRKLGNDEPNVEPARHPRDRNIAMVFQNYALYPTMKVYDNIAFSLQVKNLPKTEIDEKVKWAAGILDLTSYLDRYPKALSGGQRQRVAMGRAIVRDPKVFLFDEPLSNLDAKLRGHMRYEIRRIHDQLKTTTIYVTHDQIEALTMADEIVIMRDGVIQQIGSPSAVYDRPCNLFVAEFIGSPPMNILQGKVDTENGRPVYRYKTLALPLPPIDSAYLTRPLIYGVRPTDIHLDANGEERGELILAELTGAETMIHIGVADDHLRAVIPGRPKEQKGSIVNFKVDSNKLHLFDAETGIRVN
jgi:multiple sugar transport system ATP-binding protein